MTDTNHTLGSTSAAQRARLLAHITEAGNKGITTIEAREELDIMAPAPRIYELRHSGGHNIQTIWTDDMNAQGNKHRTARYVLFPGPYLGINENLLSKDISELDIAS